MLRIVILAICLLGAASCATSFQAEWRSGKLYPSLLFSAVAWVVGALATYFLWSD